MPFRPRILVVDDDPQMLKLVGEVLAGMGAEPHCVQSSRQAAELVNREKFDGVFLDWFMPELDGLQLAERIRWSKTNSTCPMVMLTANQEPDAMRQCFRVGINFFLQKPATVDRIQGLLKAARDLMNAGAAALPARGNRTGRFQPRRPPHSSFPGGQESGRGGRDLRL